MAEIICIVNQKGGVGKTTSAINLAASLALLNKRVLLVDSDPQGNATTGLGVEKNTLSQSLYHGLIGEANVEDLLLPCAELPLLSVLPSRVELIGFEIEMVDAPERHAALKNLLSSIVDQYDYILIDCPPSLSLLTVNAMCAANSVLIPLQCEFYAMEGLTQLLETIKYIRNELNPQLQILGILLTMFDKRTNLSSQVADEVREYFQTMVFDTIIPRNIRLTEAPSFGKPIVLYAAASPGAQSYLELAQNLINK